MRPIAEAIDDLVDRLRFHRQVHRLHSVNNRTTLSRWIRDYGFPPGDLIGPNTRAWTDEEIETWQKAKSARDADAAKDGDEPEDEEEAEAA